MNSIRIAILLFCTLSAIAVAGPEEKALETAQTFYDDYLKIINGTHPNEKKWILKSDHITASFKKAYTAVMKDPGSDPIICGQDFPKAGFKASIENAKGDSVIVKMSSRDPSFAYSFKATFVQNDGKWLLAGTDEIKLKK